MNIDEQFNESLPHEQGDDNLLEQDLPPKKEPPIGNSESDSPVLEESPKFESTGIIKSCYYNGILYKIEDLLDPENEKIAKMLVEDGFTGLKLKTTKND